MRCQILEKDDHEATRAIRVFEKEESLIPVHALCTAMGRHGAMVENNSGDRQFTL